MGGKGSGRKGSDPKKEQTFRDVRGAINRREGKHVEAAKAKAKNTFGSKKGGKK